MKLGILKVLNGLLLAFFIFSCAAKFTTYTLEDVEKQRLGFKSGNEKALRQLTAIYKDRNQSYDVRLAAIRALSESRDPIVISDIQSSVRNASLIELDLMKEAIKIIIQFEELSTTDSLLAALKSTENKSMEIREALVNAIGKNGTKDEVYTLIELYHTSKRNNAHMNKLLATTLGEIGDEKVIPILMEIAKNKHLPVAIRSLSVDILARKQAPELVDFFVEMLGDPATRDKVNEYALTVMGELSEERMILALMEAYQVGRHEYYSLLNTIINSLADYDNPAIKSVYLEIAKTEGFPSSVRLKALKGLTQYSEPEIVADVIQLLNDPANYIYYNEIISMIRDHGVYDHYVDKLRLAAFQAMKKESGYLGTYHD